MKKALVLLSGGLDSTTCLLYTSIKQVRMSVRIFRVLRENRDVPSKTFTLALDHGIIQFSTERTMFFVHHLHRYILFIVLDHRGHHHLHIWRKRYRSILQIHRNLPEVIGKMCIRDSPLYLALIITPI